MMYHHLKKDKLEEETKGVWGGELCALWGYRRGEGRH